MLIGLVGCSSIEKESSKGTITGSSDSFEEFSSSSSDSTNIVNDKGIYVVYINFDGFAKYYYDEADKLGKVPNLRGLLGDGIFFNNFNNLFPSITNPMQAMIISGATSSKTRNVYRFFNKNTNTVVQQQRENAAQTIYEAAVDAKMSVASVRHFPAEETLTSTKTNRLYVTEPFGTVADVTARFQQAIKMVRLESFLNGSIRQKLEEVPRLLSIYCDDLDSLGHNTGDTYAYKKALSEEQKLNNIIDCLQKMDEQIGLLVQAYKDMGLYDKTAFLLTTDHGMTSFGIDGGNYSETLKYGKTKWPDLKNKLLQIDSSLTFEYLAAGVSPKSSTKLVGVGSGLQMPITFIKDAPSEEGLQEIASALESEEYIDNVLTRKELIDVGIWRNANVDLLVVPSERYHFHGRDNPNNLYVNRGQHDTNLVSSSNVFAAAFGGAVEKKGKVADKGINISFGVMIADALGIKLLDADAEHISFLKEN